MNKSDQEKQVLLGMIKEGVAPTRHNYAQWNLLGDAVLITFNPAQIAPSYYGVQEVTVPFSALNSALVAPFKIKDKGKI